MPSASAGARAARTASGPRDSWRPPSPTGPRGRATPSSTPTCWWPTWPRGSTAIWSAPDARLLYSHSRTAGFLYQGALRAGLTRALGVRFGEVSRGMAELDGVPKALLRALLDPPTGDRAPDGRDRRHLGPLGRSGGAGHPLGQRSDRRRCHDGGTAAALAGPGRRARLGTDGGTADRSTTSWASRPGGRRAPARSISSSTTWPAPRD